jgi:hypothetical protein
VPVLSLLGATPAGLVTISDCVIWDISSLFVATYDLQDYGGSILSRLHTSYLYNSGKNKNFCEELIPWIPSIHKDRIEDYALNSSSIVTPIFVSELMFLRSHYVIRQGNNFTDTESDGNSKLYRSDRVPWEGGQIHRQHCDLMNIVFFQNKECKLIIVMK